MHKQDHTTTDPGLQSIIESMYTAASLEPLCEKSHAVKCKHCGGTGKHDDGSKCPKCKGTGEILLGEGEYGKTGAADPETGERMSPKQHAKYIQWTKDLEAKIAKAQEIGDSKEANKLQRYLDMHGVWEDNARDVPVGFKPGDFVDIDDPDDEYASQAEWVVVQVEGDSVTVAKVDENDVRTLPAQNVTNMGGAVKEDDNGAIASTGGDRFNSQYNIGTDADGAALEQGHIVQYDPTGAHQNDPQVSDAQWIVSGSAVAGPDNEDMVDIIQLGKDISVPAKHLLVQGELGG